jgi:hypothetical protein
VENPQPASNAAICDLSQVKYGFAGEDLERKARPEAAEKLVSIREFSRLPPLVAAEGTAQKK